MTRLVAFLVTSLVLSAPALATPAPFQPTKDQLRDQFAARAAQLRDMKQRAVVGETIDGYVDPVDPAAASDKAIEALVRDENADRRRLYEILADEINAENPQARVKATRDTIAVRNALRNIEKAAPGERLRVAKGHWIFARDYPRYERLMQLKAQGKVGETTEGLVEAVKPEDAGDPGVSAIVTQENAARNAEYAATAQRERTQPGEVATRMARRNVENAKVGEMIKDAKGAWQRK